MQHLLFTSRGPTPGLILVEWNIQAESAGSAGLWDCHARLGGVTGTGTELTPAEWLAVTTGTDQGCGATSLMMHLTASASGYFENMWLWGSDHMIEWVTLPPIAHNVHIYAGMHVYTTRSKIVMTDLINYSQRP